MVALMVFDCAIEMLFSHISIAYVISDCKQIITHKFSFVNTLLAKEMKIF